MKVGLDVRHPSWARFALRQQVHLMLLVAGHALRKLLRRQKPSQVPNLLALARERKSAYGHARPEGCQDNGHLKPLPLRPP